MGYEYDDIKDIIVDLFVTVKYGVKIPDIAWKIQDKVKKTLEDIFEVFGDRKISFGKLPKRGFGDNHGGRRYR